MMRVTNIQIQIHIQIQINDELCILRVTRSWLKDGEAWGGPQGLAGWSGRLGRLCTMTKTKLLAGEGLRRI